MSAPTQTLEELAEYEYIVEKTFLSEDNGYEFFNAFARNKGFRGRLVPKNKKFWVSHQYLTRYREGFSNTN